MDEMKTRVYMRGETKNARAEELLALIKAEREVEEIEKNEVPNTLRKRPLLPAILPLGLAKESCNEGLVVQDTTQNFSVKNNSRFLWRDWDLEENIHNSMRNERTKSEPCVTTRNCSPHDNCDNSIEVASKNLPPLRTIKTKSYSQGFERPGCPEPPSTPPFEISSHGT